MKKILALAATASALALAAPAMAVVPSVNIYAGYSGGADSTILRIVTNSSLTNVKISGVTSPGAVADTLTIGNLGAGTFNCTFGLNDGCGSSVGGPFSYDYDDYVGFGEATYTFSAMLGSNPISAVFSPTSNASGGFVGFLGNNAAGFETDATVELTLVGVAAGAPEPATWAMMILGIGAVGFAMRRRQQAKVRFAF